MRAWRPNDQTRSNSRKRRGLAPCQAGWTPAAPVDESDSRGGDQIRPAAMLMVRARSVVLKKNAITPCRRASRRNERDEMETSAVCDVVPMTKEKYRKSR